MHLDDLARRAEALAARQGAAGRGILGIAGAPGAGKSTLAMALVGIAIPVLYVTLTGGP